MDWDYGVTPESSAVAQVKPAYSPFVDGAFVDGTGAPSTAWNPATDAPLTEVRAAGAAEVDRAVAAARRAQPTWAGITGGDRARLLVRLAGAVAGRAAELAVLETLGTGRLVRLTRDVDLPTAVAHLQSCAGWADKPGYAGHGPDPRPLGVVGARVGGGPALLTPCRGSRRRWPAGTRLCSCRTRTPR